MNVSATWKMLVCLIKWKQWNRISSDSKIKTSGEKVDAYFRCYVQGQIK